MSFNDIAPRQLRFTRTSKSAAAPPFMSHPSAGCFTLIHLTLHEVHEGPSRDREHHHPVYHLVLFSQADNEFLMDGRKIPSSRGLCVLAPPGIPHSFQPCRKGLTRYHEITFTFETGSPSWSELLTHYTGVPLATSPTLIQIPEPTLLNLAPILSRLDKAMTGQGSLLNQQLHFGLLECFAFIAGAMLEQESHSQSIAPEIRVRDYLNSNFARGSDLADAAAIAGVSAAHLGRAFKHRYGISPGRYQDELRMDAARNLLLNSNLLVKEIAFQLGYSDAFTFSKAFRRHGNRSPRAYRDKAENS